MRAIFRVYKKFQFTNFGLHSRQMQTNVNDFCKPKFRFT